MRPLMWCCSYVFPLCRNNPRMLTLCITNSLFWMSTLPLLWKTSGATDTPMGNSSCKHLAHGKMVVQSLLVASSNGMLWHPLRRSVAVACLVFAFSLSSLLGTHGRDSSNLCSLHSTLENFLVMRPSALMAKEHHLKMMGLEQGPRTSLMLFANKELIGCRAEASRLQKYCRMTK